MSKLELRIFKRKLWCLHTLGRISYFNCGWKPVFWFTALGFKGVF